jgi:hypothetical protein
MTVPSIAVSERDVAMSMHRTDFMAIGAERGLLTALLGRGQIVSSGVRRGSHATGRTEFCVGPRSLGGCGAQVLGDALPVAAVNEAGWQM